MENVQISAAPAITKFTKPIPLNGNSKQKNTEIDKIEEEKKKDEC